MYMELWNHIGAATNPTIPGEDKSDQDILIFHFLNISADSTQLTTLFFMVHAPLLSSRSLQSSPFLLLHWVLLFHLFSGSFTHS